MPTSDAQRSERVSSSFRDPSGFVFSRDGTLYRQINRSYAEVYEGLKRSRLFDVLMERGLLIPHDEVDVPAAEPANGYAVVRPELVRFTSHPFEWCFGQLRDAALLHLRIMRVALEHGFWLKDCTAYNAQFHRGRPVLVDTLSFDHYVPSAPWPAYRQFCQHFLAPLALMAYRDVRLGQLSRTHLDGVPLTLAAALLPARSKLVPGLLMHLHLHAASERRAAARTASAPRRKGFALTALRGLVDSLEAAVHRLRWKADTTYWANYYGTLHGYTDAAEEVKRAEVASVIERVKPSLVWDFGANTGRYSRLASDAGVLTVSMDADHGAVELNYRSVVERAERNLLPLVMDLTNPSPSIGWALEERASLLSRGPADLGLALALVHHLALANNVRLEQMARFFATTCRALVIEFVPAHDRQAQRLIAGRAAVFSDYTEEAFRSAFSHHFAVTQLGKLPGSDRVLFLMKHRGCGER